MSTGLLGLYGKKGWDLLVGGLAVARTMPKRQWIFFEDSLCSMAPSSGDNPIAFRSAQALRTQAPADCHAKWSPIG
jgi:hypothetical protein